MTYAKRQRFFLVLAVIFAITLPAIIFYTTGYRLNLGDTENRIVTTGGMYITTNTTEVEVYLDEEQVRRPRLFRSAYYIQNIEAGKHRVVVQKENLHTWVKQLPVDPYIVIEAASFNMPLTPTVRLIPEFRDGAGVALYTEAIPVLDVATTTDVFVSTTTSPRLTWTINSEYDFVASLFATTSTSTAPSIIGQIVEQVERFGFSSSSATSTEATSSPQLFTERGNMRLREVAGELTAQWIGSPQSVPYYFCVGNTPSSSVAARYGDHVAVQVEEQRLSTTTPLHIDDEGRLCRQQIQIDRKQQMVKYFAFMPGTSDLILLQLEDGIYVTEIDDRSWQNTQRVYTGAGVDVIVHNDVIYLKAGSQLFELITDIESL